jgi:DNA polymerase elongation subunit (family B)
MSEIGLLPEYNGELILGRFNSDDWLLMDVFYQRPTKDTNYVDYAYIVLKNVHTGEKKLATAQNPEMLLYVVDEEYRNYTHTRSWIELAKCHQVRVKYKNVIKSIAEIGGKRTLEVYDYYKQNNFAGTKNLFRYPYVMAADYNYPDYLRIEWALHYHNKNIEIKLTKMYLDIEVDGIDIPGFPQYGECPINAISLVDEESSTVYVYLLDNPSNPQIDEFMNNIDTHLREYHAAFDETYGVLDYKILLFEDELEMLVALFQLINTLKRDILLTWNGYGFDIPYIIERIKVLKADPVKVMCPKEFKTPFLEFRKDTSTYDWKAKNDTFVITAFTQYEDQMSNYIKIRKGKSELKTIKLNAIAWKELKDEKLDYSDEADIKTLPYKNYVKFVMYNIKDTLLQMGIERKTKDSTAIFLNMVDNATPYKSIFSQTLVLKNYAYLSYYKQGYIIGNNRNIDYSKPRTMSRKKKEKSDVKGALVGDPLLNLPVGATLFGKPSKFIFRYVIDFDLI